MYVLIAKKLSEAKEIANEKLLTKNLFCKFHQANQSLFLNIVFQLLLWPKV